MAKIQFEIPKSLTVFFFYSVKFVRGSFCFQFYCGKIEFKVCNLRLRYVYTQRNDQYNQYVTHSSFYRLASLCVHVCMYACVQA